MVDGMHHCVDDRCHGDLQETEASHRMKDPQTIQVVTSTGIKSAWNWGCACRVCGKKYYEYFSVDPSSNQHPLRASEWTFVDNAEMPSVILSSENIGFHTELLKALDTCMLRSPFTWDAVGKELQDHN